MYTIGLIAAMNQESAALLHCVKGWKRIAAGTLRGYTFTVSSKTCLLVTSGMGMRRAGEAARTLLQMSSPGLLISFGIAGAVEADLGIGDVVLAEAVCRLEQGAPGSLLPLEPWSDESREAAAQALSNRGAHLFTGTAVTTGGEQVMEGQLPGVKHPILEMETAGIAQLAAGKGIPLLSLRAISDGPCAPLPFDLGDMMDEDANLQTGRLLRAIIRNPTIIFQSVRMMRNTKIAAGNAALALLAALSKNAIGHSTAY